MLAANRIWVAAEALHDVGPIAGAVFHQNTDLIGPGNRVGNLHDPEHLRSAGFRDDHCAHGGSVVAVVSGRRVGRAGGDGARQFARVAEEQIPIEPELVNARPNVVERPVAVRLPDRLLENVGTPPSSEFLDA